MPLIEQEPQRIRFETKFVTIKFLDTIKTEKTKQKIREKTQDGINIDFSLFEQNVTLSVTRDMVVCYAEDFFAYIDEIKAIIISNIL